MLDLDRVEMILPQVHLRNGDIELRKQYICRQNPSADARCCASKWLSSAEFLPRLPPHGSAFAGDGLNIRRLHCSVNTPTLTVSERSPNERRFAADCPLFHPRRCYHPRGRYPPCCTPVRTGAAVVCGFRASPTSLSQLRLAPCAPLGFQQ
jgi:hypothetical protein